MFCSNKWIKANVIQIDASKYDAMADNEVYTMKLHPLTEKHKCQSYFRPIFKVGVSSVSLFNIVLAS